MRICNLKTYQEEVLDDTYIIKPDIFNDKRGYFFEKWNKEAFKKLTNLNINFVQDNESNSQKGVIRGLHYQLPPKGQIKLVSVIKGSVYDVVVDLRENSKTFKKWAGLELSESNKKQLLIPIGFAHGFKALEDNTVVQYKVSNYWDASKEVSLIWNDHDVNIKWPEILTNEEDEFISKKDLNAKTLRQILASGEIF